MLQMCIAFFVCSFLCFTCIAINDDLETTRFDFASLTLPNLKLLGDAHFKNSSVHLSKDLSVPNSGSGRVLYTKPVRFRKADTLLSFSTFFSFVVYNLNPSSIGGGLAFLITSDNQSVGDPGGFLGVVNESKKYSNSVVAVEFDTLMDVEFQDINGNHVGLDLNSLVSVQVADLDAVNIDLKSGNIINAWVDYDGFTRMLNVSVSYSNLKPNDPLLSLDLDLSKYVDEYMFLGFSGSTQGSTEIHSIEWWSFTSSISGSSTSQSPSSSFPSNSSSANFSNSLSPSLSPSYTQGSQKVSTACHNQLCKKNPGAVAGFVTAGAFFLVLSFIIIWVFSRKHKPLNRPQFLATDFIKTPKEYSYKDLKSATKNFDTSRIIGHGAFGTVYRGEIAETGAIVAVKRCSHTGGQGKTEFLSELSIIGTLRHRNLVKLLGWCHEKDEILLVYEYMANGSLDKALYESRCVLPWRNRCKILAGIASALSYLHQECENQVIHRDVKASNVMIDANFNARLGDFGLARQIEHGKSPEATVTAGTMGYLAPEYLLTGKATEKTDIFSFGACVLEVVCGRRVIDKELNGSNLVEFVWNLHRENRILEAADLRLNGEFDEEEMRRILMVGLLCSHPDPDLRPNMRNIMQMLSGETPLPFIPRSKPSASFSTVQLLLSLQDSFSDCNDMMLTVSTSTSGSFNGGPH